MGPGIRVGFAALVDRRTPIRLLGRLPVGGEGLGLGGTADKFDRGGVSSKLLNIRRLINLSLILHICNV